MNLIYLALCVILSSVCRSLIETLQHHFKKSVFNHKKLNPLWFNPRISWKNKYSEEKQAPLIGSSKLFKFVNYIIGSMKIVQLSDAFHFFKMYEIGFYISSICFAASLDLSNWYEFVLLFFYISVLWNNTFVLFYKKVWLSTT